MGSFSHLEIAGYPIYDIKNDYNEDAIEYLFLMSDFVEEERQEADGSNFPFKGFIQTAKVCRERLEIYGATLHRAKQDFSLAKVKAHQEGLYSFPVLKILFEKYLAEIKDIVEKHEVDYDMIYVDFRESLITGELGLFGQSMKYHLYSILSQVPDDAVVEYDLTAVIDSGWVKMREIRKLEPEKIILLTEGRTDVEFISAVLKKLYPYLYEYYHFIDFEEYKVESNASALVKLVISLAASNIKHPIIVLFDNDTSGIMEMKRLKINLPNNIKVLRYPDINLGKKYPTIGPTGKRKMNINGTACSIELYFGEDVLMAENAVLVPIQWKAYNEHEKKYQGEISCKKDVQNRFRNKLLSESVAGYEDMDLILKEIFSAFR